VIENAITPQDEQGLIANCQHELRNEDRRTWSGRSAVVRFGWSYDSNDSVHEWLGACPAWLDPWIQIFGADSVTINHYLTGSGIHPHVDSLDFDDPIRILNLGSPVVMVFDKPGLKLEMLIPNRSLTVIGGESRTGWRHGIEPRHYDLINGKSVERKERWSIVLRRLLKKHYGNRTTSSGTVAGPGSTMP
jgi:alkylated DNA repair dioxygenase AlkB